MKGVGRLTSPNPTVKAKDAIIASSSFSTFSGSGGRGRGRGSSPFIPVDISDSLTPESSKDAEEITPTPNALGHGRGKPVHSSPILPSFPSWISDLGRSVGRGRGIGAPHDPEPESSLPKKPIFFRRDDISMSSPTPPPSDTEHGTPLPESLSSALAGSGRGKLLKPPSIHPPAQEENRHLRMSSRPGVPTRGGPSRQVPRPALSQEAAVKKAVQILGRGVGRGRGMRGRGFGRGRGIGGRGRAAAGDDDLDKGLYLGDNADGERLAKHLGEENMVKLKEAFDEVSWDALPSPLDDAYMDAVDINNKIEFEPEYLMGDFEKNPDIDEKPPIPLRDALEKMKPFLVAYEGIKSQQEWEEVIEDLMKKVPIFKELIDHYCGPDRVTAKQQQEELQRVAKTLPENVPGSVKNFTNRAVLSLQSNPGWGWDKKCQFMDKLVWEVTHHYK